MRRIKNNFTIIGIVAVILFFLIAGLACAADQPGYQYYYKQLSDCQKEVYDFLLTAPHETGLYVIDISSDIPTFSEEEIYMQVSDTVKACQYDNPEQTAWIQCVSIAGYDLGQKQIALRLERSEHYDEDDTVKISSILDRIVANANPAWNNYTKAYYIASTITSCMLYDDNYVLYGEESKASEDKQHITGILNGVAVCEGYSELFKALADRLGLPCVEVASVSHSFVHIQMEDGKWYGHDPQNNISLSGDSMFMGVEGENIYEINDREFYYLSQPHRTENDYNTPSIVPVINVVDVAAVREELNEGLPQFIYRVNDDGITCTIVQYKGKQQGDLIIPDSIDGYPVTRIGNSAFAFCRWFRGGLFIPDTVKFIGSGAFAFCSGLTGDVILPESLQVIGDSAFVNCSGLNGTIQFNQSLQCIRGAAFSYCSGLKGDLMLPDSMTQLDAYAFQACKGLTGTVHIPTSIGQWNPAIVEECENLSSFDVSDSNPLYSVVDGILYDKEMTTVIQCINGYQGEVIIPEGVTRIGAQAFYSCRKITSFRLPSTIRWIDDWAFGNTTGRIRDDLSLPSSIERIGDCAFYNSNCGGTIYYPGIDNVGFSAFGFNPYVRRVLIPEGVTSIPGDCFGVAQIRDVYIPESVVSIGEGAFGYSYDLIIHGIPGSYAEEYAAQHQDMRFRFASTANIIWQDEVEYFIAVDGINYPASIQLKAKMMDTNEDVQFVSWSSLEPYIAEVENGVVTARSGGWTTIEAMTSDGACVSWTIYCMRYPIGISAGSDKSVLYIGETATVYASWIPGDVALFDDESIIYRPTFESSDPSIVMVDGITIVGKKTGTATITARNEVGMTSSFDVTVELIPQGMNAVQLPGTLNRIENEAFENTPFDIVIIPGNCTYIGSHAFRNCKSLKYVRVPANAWIAPDAFEGCESVILDVVTE